jgi:hypothetical protein
MEDLDRFKAYSSMSRSIYQWGLCQRNLQHEAAIEYQWGIQHCCPVEFNDTNPQLAA